MEPFEILSAVTAGTVQGLMRSVADWRAGLSERRMTRADETILLAADIIESVGAEVIGVDDRLLVEIIEGASLQPGPDEVAASEEATQMRIRWAILLANASIAIEAAIPAAFPAILSQLEPIEVAVLEWLDTQSAGTDIPTFLEQFGYSRADGGDWHVYNAHAQNLERLRLCTIGLDYQRIDGSDSPPPGSVRVTDFGRRFVAALSRPTGAQTGAQGPDPA